MLTRRFLQSDSNLPTPTGDTVENPVCGQSLNLTTGGALSREKTCSIDVSGLGCPSCVDHNRAGAGLDWSGLFPAVYFSSSGPRRLVQGCDPDSTSTGAGLTLNTSLERI
ncbi:unnamed protein product [Pleuronectes platessa]|uniref:Uncharacterized protein n=1 Tax=Pleuronectes platessa TaxID=8262 RepID=A0A9N7Z0R0_PLEPL|nr:unnamed protein product [Pleuronectes platessa]